MGNHSLAGKLAGHFSGIGATNTISNNIKPTILRFGGFILWLPKGNEIKGRAMKPLM